MSLLPEEEEAWCLFGTMKSGAKLYVREIGWFGIRETVDTFVRDFWAYPSKIDAEAAILEAKEWAKREGEVVYSIIAERVPEE